jgi:hypothetical protein
MDPADFKCNWLKHEEIWLYADNIRQLHWPEMTLPIRLGLNIEPKLDLRREADMDAFLRADLTGIVVDQDMYMDERYEKRLRFSFAHELGHYFIHDYVYTKLFNSVDDWREFILNVSDSEYRSFEYQANEFAGRLLVPKPVLIKEMKKIVSYLRTNKLEGYLASNPDDVLARISPMISRAFGISTDVAETRIQRENLWPPPSAL